MVAVILLYTFVRTNQTAHLNGVCFSVCKLYFNKVKVHLINRFLKKKKCDSQDTKPSSKNLAK